MEVAARGDGALVAELGLDHGEGVALTCELRRMGVSEAVGMHALFDAGLRARGRSLFSGRTLGARSISTGRREFWEFWPGDVAGRPAQNGAEARQVAPRQRFGDKGLAMWVWRIEASHPLKTLRSPAGVRWLYQVGTIVDASEFGARSASAMNSFSSST